MKIARSISATIIFALFAGGALAQEDSSHHKSAVPQKDLVDVIRAALGKPPVVTNDTSEKELERLHYSVVPAVGYTLSSGWAFILATNAGFYTSDPAHTNMSSISATFIYSQYSQVTIPLQTNIWTRDNQYDIVGDWRYYKYPQDTYGLGGHTNLEDADLIDYSHVRIHQSVLKKITNDIYGGIGYFMDYHWNIKEGGPDSSSSDAKKYGLTPTSMSSGPVLNVLYDSRKNSINPDGGFYANVLYRDNLTFLGSDENWQSLVVDVRKYIRFPAGSNNILALWNLDWLTLAGKPPYLDLPSTGWDAYNNTGRGYIQGRFRGKNMLYFESEYRFRISPNGLFGGVVFGNLQSFSEYPSNSFEVLWPAVGAGLRIKVNKHSNTNIAIDYGFGADGSRGLFVNLGEVF